MSHVTRKFKGAWLRDVIHEDVSDAEIVSQELIDTSRWSLYYELVFRFEGKLYSVTYSRGATESQDEQPFEYEDEVTCTEVSPVEKTVTVYEPVLLQ